MSKEGLTEYRCTRSRPYEAPGCPGYNSHTGRQGHYIFAKSPLGAALQMIEGWPDEILHGFTLQPKGTDNVYVWTLEKGIEGFIPGKDGGLEGGRDGLCDVHWGPLDVGSTIERGNELLESDPKVAEVIDTFHKLRIMRSNQVEKERAAIRAKEEEERYREKTVASASETKTLSGTVTLSAQLSKTLDIRIPTELLDYYKETVETGNVDDALNQINTIFEEEAMKNPVEHMDGIAGWTLDDIDDIIVEW